MKLEMIFKRENGMQYQIKVDLYVDPYKEIPVWRINCWCRDKGKRVWNVLPDTLPDYSFRGLSMAEREIHKDKNILRFVTAEEILSAKLLLWNRIKPELLRT